MAISLRASRPLPLQPRCADRRSRPRPLRHRPHRPQRPRPSRRRRRAGGRGEVPIEDFAKDRPSRGRKSWLRESEGVAAS